MKHILKIVFTGLLISVSATAEASDLIAHARPRPPELIVENDQTISGPLKDVLDEAARSAGLTISWVAVPFPRSLSDLQNKEPVIVPRVIKTEDREKFITFLTPIAEQKKHVNFVVAKGNESKISKYDDLRTLSVGLKRGTVYFDKLDNDNTINKTFVVDDNTLCKMLRAGHIDVIATIDLAATELMMKSIGYSDYNVSQYREDFTMGNYFAISKNGPLQPKAEVLNASLREMVEQGKVDKIYQKYNLDPREIKE